MPRKPTIRLLITDLDNTLYDWVTYFATSMYSMIRAAAPMLDVSEDVLVEDLRSVHCRQRNTDHPFALLETDAVERAFPRLSRSERAVRLERAFGAFNDARARSLVLYPKVRETLAAIRRSGAIVVAHTDAHAINAAFRLKWLGIDRLFDAIYAPAGSLPPHPDVRRNRTLDDVVAKVRPLAPTERKPRPETVLRICNEWGVLPSEALYVGDSLIRDVGMAKAAGTVTAWARYGTRYDLALLEQIRRVTHWTREEVGREKGAACCKRMRSQSSHSSLTPAS